MYPLTDAPWPRSIPDWILSWYLAQDWCHIKIFMSFKLFSRFLLSNLWCYGQQTKLDLEFIGSSVWIDWELIWSGVKWSGPDIRPGLDNRHLIIEGHRGLRRWWKVIEGHRRSWKVMEGQGRSRKVKEGYGWSRKVMEGLFPSLDLQFR